MRVILDSVYGPTRTTTMGTNRVMGANRHEWETEIARLKIELPLDGLKYVFWSKDLVPCVRVELRK